MWVAYNNFLLKSTIWKGEKNSNFIVRNLTNTISARWTRSTSIVINHVGSIYPWCDAMKWHFASTLFFSQTHNSCVIMRRTLDKYKLRTILTSTTQNCQGHKNKGNLRNCQSQEDPKETWLLPVMWYPGWVLGTE